MHSRLRAFLGLFQGRNHRWPSHLNLGKPSKNHWCQWLIWKKTFNGDGPGMVKPLKNHRWQWCLGKKTLPSHRSKKMTIVEVYPCPFLPLSEGHPFACAAGFHPSARDIEFELFELWCRDDRPSPVRRHYGHGQWRQLGRHREWTRFVSNTWFGKWWLGWQVYEQYSKISWSTLLKCVDHRQLWTIWNLIDFVIHVGRALPCWGLLWRHRQIYCHWRPGYCIPVSKLN